MFSVRIHSLDTPHTEEGCSRSTAAVAPLHPSPELVDDAVGDLHEEAGTSRNPNPNPRIQLLRGIVHLYRSLPPPSTSSSSSSSSTNPQASSESLLPAVRGTLLLILAVPSRLSPEDLLRFCGSYVERSSAIRALECSPRRDKLECHKTYQERRLCLGPPSANSILSLMEKRGNSGSEKGKGSGRR
ncbi:hypothetical protein C4D60_Mb08t17450 [Musa balbisiana]|uniref:BRCA1-associated 2/ETP1 RRM domain-containing protein n=1 Tax=Musa balbisiana TaxID=52838 RepID=A0A4S8K4L9_MUSBA|nr:hypothetical protein C4D60_Mb08t17450 [Musa balbisiana]